MTGGGRGATVRDVMSTGRRRWWLLAAVSALAMPLLRAPWSSQGTATRVSAVGARSSTAAEPGLCDGPVHWVGAWMAAPQDTSALVAARGLDGDPTPAAARASFTDQSFRMMVTPHIGGSELRVRLSNRFGTDRVTFSSVHVARRRAGAAVVAGTDHVVTFDSGLAVTIAPGTDALSDPVDLAVDAFQDVAISFYVASTASLDVHLDALQTQYLTPPGAGDHTADADGAAFDHPVLSWLAVTGVDVLASPSVGAVAVVGDSLTDGLGSTADADDRWPDDLARRALGNGAPISVLNGGISGNQVARDNLARDGLQDRGAGPSAVNRLDADALQRSGVRTVVVFAGINDLFSPSTANPVSAVVAGYEAIIERAHTAGVRVAGATLTPGDQDGAFEMWRQAINNWIRSSGRFDAVLDLDAAVRDPAHTNRIAPGLTNEIVHFNDTGYRTLAASIDLGALRASGCAGQADGVR
jgi:lysophospholipase L1-like esterase